MTKRRVLAIALDGYEPTLAARMSAEGLMPAWTALRARGACMDLEHYGEAKRTGLAAEHFATALSPDAAARWAAVNFDSRTYDVSQEPTALPPFPASLDARTVVFDAAYFDLKQTPSVRGLVNWGAHDPGVPAAARPEDLHAEITARFGDYPAAPWIYGFVWQSPERTRAMAADVVRAVDVRAQAAEWLLAERLPDWDLGIVMVSEAHSAIEALWHGVDVAHPLHDLPSAAPAGEGVRAVYIAIDRLIGRLATAFPDACLVVFSMHGMGANDSDVASMVLLPELLYRRAFGRPHMGEGDWPLDASGVPLLPEDGDWHAEMWRLVPDARSRLDRLKGRFRPKPADEVGWMPATRYRPFWPKMPAFALPSFYDGRIRINLAGREAKGTVAVEDYHASLEALEDLLRACVDPVSGQPVVASIERSVCNDPRDLAPSQADLTVVWRDCPLGLVHPELGRIGPLPYRRTGGHTGRYGMAMIAGKGVAPGDYGVRSAFDVAPTIVDLLGARPTRPMSGESVLDLVSRRR